MFGKKECFSSIRCSTQAVRASKRPLYPLPTHRRSHIMYRQILSASLTFIKLSRVTISRRVVYSVFIMHRRKDLWGPDGKRLYFLSAFVDLVFPGQLRNLILTASSTIVYTSISHHNQSSSSIPDFLTGKSPEELAEICKLAAQACQATSASASGKGKSPASSEGSTSEMVNLSQFSAPMKKNWYGESLF